MEFRPRFAVARETTEEPTGSRERFEERHHDVTREQGFARCTQASRLCESTAEVPDKALTYPYHIGASCHLVIARKAPHWEKVMKNLALKVRRFLVSEDGPTAVEYAVMLALIIIVCLTAINSIGTNANLTFTDVANSIATS